MIPSQRAPVTSRTGARSAVMPRAARSRPAAGRSARPGRRAGGPARGLTARPGRSRQAGPLRAGLLVDGYLQRDLGPFLEVGHQRAPARRRRRWRGTAAARRRPGPQPRLTARAGSREPDQQQLGELDADGRQLVAGRPRDRRAPQGSRGSRTTRACGQPHLLLPRSATLPVRGPHGSRGRGDYPRAWAAAGSRTAAAVGRGQRRSRRRRREEDQQQSGRQQGAPGQASTSWPSWDQQVWKLPGGRRRR